MVTTLTPRDRLLTWRRHHAAGRPRPRIDLPELRVRGAFFELADGTYWTARQCSDFNLLARYLDGEDITPVLAQRQACDFNLLRVWTLFDIPGIGTLTDPDYDRIPAFVDLCERYGLYVEFTAYTGINPPGHWHDLITAALACRPHPLLELVNELDQNTNEPDSDGRIFVLEDYDQAPAPLLSSHGSNGSEAWPVTPHWSYATFHTNDASEWQRKVGHNAMEIWGGPTLTNENTRYTDKAHNMTWAYDAAAGAALLCAGSCYHSTAGKTSVRWAGAELEGALAWATGALSVRVRYQDGAYRHEHGPESPEGDISDPANPILRVYDRVLPDGAYERVTIRK
jgi:hypothetical protein